MPGNLLRLQIIRAIVGALQLCALGYARWGLALDLDYSLILGILALLTAINGFLLWRQRRWPIASENDLLLHLGLDIVGLSLLIYFTGGATNPFVSYLLVPVTIAAASLPWLLASATAVMALLCYSLLLFWYTPLPALMPQSAAAMDHLQHEGMTAQALPNLHSIGMWFNFSVSAALIIYFVVRLSHELRQREQRLQHYREETLRNEQILAVATQAAGTAHMLGTPLGTMAVLLKELKEEHANDDTLQEDLSTLQQQVQLCRSTLQKLARKADFKQLQVQRVSLGTFLQQLLQQWQLLRPEVRSQFSMQTGESPDIAEDPSLEQALINLLNNAADACAEGITIRAEWNAGRWRLQIRDEGAGIPRELQEELGTRIISNKSEGMGVGLVLSQATLNRLGGSVALYPQQPKGTLTVIDLPLWSSRD